MGKTQRPAADAPLISDELVAWVDRAFPDRCPKPTDTDRQIWMAVGARQVVERLALENRRQRAPTTSQ